MVANQLLVLHYDDFADRTANLFRQLSASPATRQLFLQDPAGTVRAAVLPDRPPPPATELNQANRFLFALLSNADLMTWAETYNATLRQRFEAASQSKNPEEEFKQLALSLDRAAIYNDIIQAIAQNAEPAIINSLLPAGAPIETAFPRARPTAGIVREDDNVSVLVLVFAVAAVVVVAFAVGFLAAPTDIGGLSRDDLRAVSDMLSHDLVGRATQVRQAGTLTDPGAGRRGPVL